MPDIDSTPERTEAQRRLERLPAYAQVIVRTYQEWRDASMEMIVLNLLCLVGFISVIFGPPVLFAIHETVDLIIRGEYTGVKDFWVSVKRYFWISWLWALANLLGAFLVFNSLVFYGSLTQVWGDTLKWIIVVMGVSWFAAQFYAVPFTVLQVKPSLMQSWRNGLLLAVASPLFTFVLIVIALLITGLGAMTTIMVVLVAPSVPAILGVLAVRNRVAHYQKVMEAKQAASHEETTDGKDKLEDGPTDDLGKGQPQ